MNAAQQQIVHEWNQRLQHTGGQLQQLLQQAHAGCQQLVGQNPTDATPLGNAVGAIRQQYQSVGDLNDAFSEQYDRICEQGEGEPAYSLMKRALRGFERWQEETWQRFEASVHLDQYRAMWPHAQQAMQNPAPCSQCGRPLPRTTPHKSESLSCAACRAVSQVMPEAIVARYYAGMPHWYAESTLIDRRTALRKFRDDWEDHRDAEHAADRDRPEEPLERLRQLEAMEREYWTAYAESRVRNEGGTADDVRTLVDARMKQAFYDEMGTHDVWRKAHGLESAAEVGRVPPHLENVDEWGPVGHPQQNPRALEDDWVHDQLLNETLRDPPRHAAMLAALGYQNATHRAHVHHTFMRYYGEWMGTDEGQALLNRAVMRAMNEQRKYAAAAGAASGLLDPVEGVSIELYGSLQSQRASLGDPQQFVQLLAQHQMDMPKWERVDKEWLGRMTRDTTGAVATEYAKGFAGGGQFGGMGKAGMEVIASGQMGLAGPNAEEPVSFDRYCEISGAMAAWSKQGKDISAGLHQSFSMTAQDFSNVSMYWHQKAMADLSLIDKQSEKIEAYERQYLARP
jgi:hypothetical protein